MFGGLGLQRVFCMEYLVLGRTAVKQALEVLPCNAVLVDHPLKVSVANFIAFAFL